MPVDRKPIKVSVELEEHEAIALVTVGQLARDAFCSTTADASAVVGELADKVEAEVIRLGTLELQALGVTPGVLGSAVHDARTMAAALKMLRPPNVCQAKPNHGAGCPRRATVQTPDGPRCAEHAYLRAKSKDEPCPHCGRNIQLGMHKGEVIGFGQVTKCRPGPMPIAAPKDSEETATWEGKPGAHPAPLPIPVEARRPVQEEPIAVAIALSLYAFNTSDVDRAQRLYDHFGGECAEKQDLIEILRRSEPYAATCLAHPTAEVYVAHALERYGGEARRRVTENREGLDCDA